MFVNIFLPNDFLYPFLYTNKKFLLIGHRISNDKYVVISSVPYDESDQGSEAENNKDKYENFNKLYKVNDELYLSIIGSVNFKTNKKNFIELEYKENDKSPTFKRLNITKTHDTNGNDESEMEIKNCNFIVYKPPKTANMEYYTIEPITLSIFWNHYNNYDYLSSLANDYKNKKTNRLSSDSDSDHYKKYKDIQKHKENLQLQEQQQQEDLQLNQFNLQQRKFDSLKLDKSESNDFSSKKNYSKQFQYDNKLSSSNNENTYSEKLSFHVRSKSNNFLSELHEVIKYINLNIYFRNKFNHNYASNVYFNYFERITNFIINTIFSLPMKLFVLLQPILITIYINTIQIACYYIKSFLSYQLDLKSFSKITASSSKEGTHEKNRENKNDSSSNSIDKSKISLKLLSFTLHQMNFRANQLYHLPFQFSKTKKAAVENELSIILGIRFSPSEYIKFYNTLWLITNDYMIGSIIVSYLNENKNVIISAIKTAVSFFSSNLESLIIWLMNSPGGFKLNTELSVFFGELCLWVITFWNENIIKNYFENNLEFFFKLICYSAKYGGATFFFAVVIDIIIIFTYHLKCFYIASTKIFYWQLNVLKSLFRLFYGKKYNVLRNRVDSNNYEFDQLLFGIIIFSMIIYLFPTVIAFYITFVGLRLLNFSITNFLQFILIFLNHCPLVVILLKIKNHERLPSGIDLNLVDYNLFKLETKSFKMVEIINYHKNSMINYNLTNYSFYNKNAKLSDIVQAWNKISIPHTFQNVIFGYFIEDFQYKYIF
ncbi:hypothetical protein B5S31_g3896 [[Candida] boidinii]|nr:hypothetical protein B5S29_g2817 [[Candida] boidinii]OWB74117.1 hypothetical protein B5S31_g3896 [[Candida] boidinii]